MTNYIILRKNQGMEVWEQFTAQSASSPRGAIRKALVGIDDETADYVAIPTRSWRPVTVKVETALKFS